MEEARKVQQVNYVSVICSSAEPPKIDETIIISDSDSEYTQYITISSDDFQTDDDVESASSDSDEGGEDEKRIKKRKKRTRFTKGQKMHLYANFKICKYPSWERINKISEETELPPPTIKVWFQNRRREEKKRRHVTIRKRR